MPIMCYPFSHVFLYSFMIITAVIMSFWHTNLRNDISKPALFVWPIFGTYKTSLRQQHFSEIRKANQKSWGGACLSYITHVFRILDPFKTVDNCSTTFVLENWYSILYCTRLQWSITHAYYFTISIIGSDPPPWEKGKGLHNVLLNNCPDVSVT